MRTLDNNTNIDLAHFWPVNFKTTAAITSSPKQIFAQLNSERICADVRSCSLASLVFFFYILRFHAKAVTKTSLVPKFTVRSLSNA